MYVMQADTSSGSGHYGIGFHEVTRLLGSGDRLTATDIQRILSTEPIDRAKVEETMSRIVKLTQDTDGSVEDKTTNMVSNLSKTVSDFLYSGANATTHINSFKSIKEDITEVASTLAKMSEAGNMASDYNEALVSLKEKAKKQLLCDVIDEVNACAEARQTTYLYRSSSGSSENRPNTDGLQIIDRYTARFNKIMGLTPAPRGVESYQYDTYDVAYHAYSAASTFGELELVVKHFAASFSSIKMPY